MARSNPQPNTGPHVTEQLSAYLDGELTAAERLTVADHLRRCHACENELATLTATATLLQEMPQLASPRSFAVRPAMLERVAPSRNIFDRLGDQLAGVYSHLKVATAVASLLLIFMFGLDFTLANVNKNEFGDVMTAAVQSMPPSAANGGSVGAADSEGDVARSAAAAPTVTAYLAAAAPAFGGNQRSGETAVQPTMLMSEPAADSASNSASGTAPPPAGMMMATTTVDFFMNEAPPALTGDAPVSNTLTLNTDTGPGATTGESGDAVARGKMTTTGLPLAQATSGPDNTSLRSTANNQPTPAAIAASPNQPRNDTGSTQPYGSSPGSSDSFNYLRAMQALLIVAIILLATATLYARRSKLT